MTKIIFSLFFFLSIFLMLDAETKEIELFSIPFNQKKITYTISSNQLCDFSDVLKINTPLFIRNQNDNKLVDTLNYFQQKLNLEVMSESILNNHISFALSGSSNIYFDFYYDQDLSPCKLKRLVTIDEIQLNLDEVDVAVEFKHSLKSYVLDRIIIRDRFGGKKDLYIYPWALRGQMSAYEFNIGPALNIHTNIRVNDLNKYNKTNPVIEPIPAFFFRYGPLFLNKNGLGSLLFNRGDFSIVGMGLIEGEPYRTTGLLDRAKGTFLGTIFKYDALEFTFYNDFFDNKGYNLKLNLAPVYDYKMSWRFSPQLFIQYWDNKYMQYYYGVSESEAAKSTFTYYKPEHVLNYGFMLEFTHFFGKWTFLTSTGAKFYGPEVYDSPTVKHKTEGRFILSILYKVF